MLFVTNLISCVPVCLLYFDFVKYKQPVVIWQKSYQIVPHACDNLQHGDAYSVETRISATNVKTL